MILEATARFAQWLKQHGIEPADVVVEIRALSFPTENRLEAAIKADAHAIHMFTRNPNKVLNQPLPDDFTANGVRVKLVGRHG